MAPMKLFCTPGLADRLIHGVGSHHGSEGSVRLDEHGGGRFPLDPNIRHVPSFLATVSKFHVTRMSRPSPPGIDRTNPVK